MKIFFLIPSSNREKLYLYPSISKTEKSSKKSKGIPLRFLDVFTEIRISVF